jgi:probable F420-dependent oxidoreductase
MKVGAVYPSTELGGDVEALERFAVAIEAMGYDHLVLYDHVLGATHARRDPPLIGPYTEKDPFHDPLVAFSFLAGLTRRIELVTGILILPQRQTVLVARQAADVALLSRGRLRLGVGIGWNPVEYDALGEDFHRRGRKFDEQIPYLRRLWREELIDFAGNFHRIDRANLMPRPSAPIPIYCGGLSEPAYRRAAKLADGFIFGFVFNRDPLGGWRRIQEMLREEGRPVDGFVAQFTLHPTGERRLTIQDTVEAVTQLQDAQATGVTVNSMGKGFTGVEQHIDFMADAKSTVDAILA